MPTNLEKLIETAKDLTISVPDHSEFHSTVSLSIR